jgi:FkbM family methyltransferase
MLFERVPKCAGARHASERLALEMALQHDTGTALIIGANTGAVPNDPAFALLKRAPQWQQLWVEPVPALHSQLVANLASVPNSTAINAAISMDGATGGHLTMFCFGQDGNQTLSKLVRTFERSWIVQHHVKPFWSQMCSLDKEMLLSIERDQLARAALEPLIAKIRVPALSIDELLRTYAPHMRRQQVRYVQIDVQGFDDLVVAQLPFQNRSQFGRAEDVVEGKAMPFMPTSVIFEHLLVGPNRTAAAAARLRRLGYHVCIDHQNAVATLGAKG